MQLTRILLRLLSRPWRFSKYNILFVLYSGYFSNYLSLNIQQFGILPNIVTLLPPKKAGLLS